MNDVHFCMTEDQRSGSLRERKRNRILEAAEQLLKAHEYTDIRLEHIAEEIGMTKTNFYNYFRTKEELFLEVIGVSFERIHRRMESVLKEHAGCNDPSVFSQVVAEVVVGFHYEKAIGGMTVANLIYNVSDEQLKQFQERIENLRLRVAKLFLQTLPKLTFFDAEQLVIHLIALKDGYSAEYCVNDRMKSVMETFTGSTSKENFEKQLQSGLYYLARGMLEDRDGAA